MLIERIHNAGVVSSNPARVTIKKPLARKATGTQPPKSTSIETTHGRVSAFSHA